MTMEEYQKIIIDLDNFGKICTQKIPEKFAGDKMLIFQKIRELSHWLRDVFELEQMEISDKKFSEKIMEAKRKGEVGPNGSSTRLIPTNPAPN